MLVLTRGSGQQIMIGEDIVVTVVSSNRDKVRLGIEAPREVPVHRSEVYRAIKNEQRLIKRTRRVAAVVSQ